MTSNNNYSVNPGSGLISRHWAPLLIGYPGLKDCREAPDGPRTTVAIDNT